MADPIGTPPKIWWPEDTLTNLITFPSHATEFTMEPILRADASLSSGAILSAGLTHFGWEARVKLEPFSEVAFLDALVAFWSHAGRGGGFKFALEGDNAEVVGTYAATGGFGYIDVTSGFQPFPVGREIYVQVGDAKESPYKREAFVATNVSEFPPFSGNWRLDRGGSVNAYGWADGEGIARSQFLLANCVALQAEDPVRELPGGLYGFELSFRSDSSIVVP